MDPLIFDDKWTLSFFSFLKNNNLEIQFSTKKKKIIFLNANGEKLFSLRTSVQLHMDVQKEVLILEEFSNYLIILIRSGLAAVGLVQNGELLHHKVFRAYMVRKKQGKSQVKYLKTKGKSRAGSRVRLGETMEFFQDIGNRVNTHLKDYPVDHIGLSISTTLLPYFFNENPVLNLDKKDPRIFKIPKHVGSPTLENLFLVKNFLEKNEWYVMEGGLALLQIFNAQKKSLDHEEDSEDW